MNTLIQWANQISMRSNDYALLMVMFNDDVRYKGALYYSLLRLPKELMAQYSTERTVRAYCHLIKRAHHRQQVAVMTAHASALNTFLGHYAQSLLAIAKQQSTSQRTQ
ncbi:hypothetical protein [Vibrio parahaemolyticus]|uniref:hypothetical protein n=1 Tax=Vibrio parahaemolyticus TaxID=670 RepID=UPI002F31F6E2